jgi:hypothetical protein
MSKKVASHEASIPDDIDVEAVDRMLSSVMNRMSFAERNAMQEEIHGVGNICPEETPERIQVSLTRLQQELEKASWEKEAFLEALKLPTTYVNKNWFRLRFLRAEIYNIEKSAKRLLMFLTLVKTYFGTIGLQRPIQLSDLSG